MTVHTFVLKILFCVCKHDFEIARLAAVVLFVLAARADPAKSEGIRSGGCCETACRPRIPTAEDVDAWRGLDYLTHSPTASAAPGT